MTVRVSSTPPTLDPMILWDRGITHQTLRTVEPTQEVVSLAYVRDKVLRSPTADGYDDEDIEQIINAAVGLCEAHVLHGRPHRVIRPSTYEHRLSGFPFSGVIELQRAPLIEVTGLSYFDADDEAQSLAVSPAEFAVVGSSAYNAARIYPLSDTPFPATSTRADAVTITYTAGYSGEIPAMVLRGILLCVGELYKQRSLSQTTLGASAVPALFQPSAFWGGPF